MKVSCCVSEVTADILQYILQSRFVSKQSDATISLIEESWPAAGDPTIQISEEEVFEHSRELKRPPASFALDFGVLDSGHLTLVEMNDALGLGWYLPDRIEIYLQMLAARFKEILQPGTNALRS